MWLTCMTCDIYIACRLRQVAWFVNIWGMLVLLLGVLPYYHSYRLLSSAGGSGPHIR